jgi:DNA polymerase-3 subunit delta'
LQFKDIIGQNEDKRRLIQTVKENRVSHAQLFYGPEGSRKLAMALAYAQFINCTGRHFDADGAGGDSCGTCPSCVKFAKLIHPDLHFIYPVATTKAVDKKPMSKDFLPTWRSTLIENDYRLGLNDWYIAAGYEKKQGIINADDCSEILRMLSYKSYESEYKVMILWMADRIFHASAPKILKILEEPPDKSLFILITENQDKMLGTILSRTQAVRFPKLKDEDIFMVLTGKLSASEVEARRIVPIADGNLTRAVKILRSDEDEAYFLEKFRTWMLICLAKNIKEISNFTNEISKLTREKQKNFLAYAARIIRNAMLINYGNEGIARLNEEERNFLLKFAKYVRHDNILQFTEEFEKAQHHIDRNANSALTFFDMSLIFANLLHLAGKEIGEKS